MNTLTPSMQEKERQALSSAAVKRISRSWPDGVSVNDLKRRLPLINSRLEATEKRLNDTWLACQLDMATMPEFKAALDAWEEANYEAAAALKAVR